MAGRPSRSTRQNRPNYQETYHEQPRAKWTTSLTKTLAELMVEQVMKGNRQNNSFGKQAWIDMCEEFNNRTGLNWGTEKLKNRYGILRKQYATMKSILDVNDFSWDETQEMVVATDEVWDDYIKTHPDVETIRTNGCPLYKQLCVIFSESGTNENYDQLLYPLEMEEDHKTAVTNEESSSSTDEEEESIPIEKNKSQCISGRKRNRAGVDDIMLKAILQMVTSSRLRAATATQSSDRFSITNCVKALDEMEGIDDHLYYMALDLFDKPDFRELFMSLKIVKRLLWLKGKCNVLSSFMI